MNHPLAKGFHILLQNRHPVGWYLACEFGHFSRPIAKGVHLRLRGTGDSKTVMLSRSFRRLQLSFFERSRFDLDGVKY